MYLFICTAVKPNYSRISNAKEVFDKVRSNASSGSTISSPRRCQTFQDNCEFPASFTTFTMASEADAQVLALPPPEAEFHLSSLVYDMSHQVQMAMVNMFKMTNEFDQDSMGITEEISRCKDSALERKKALEDEKERFQKAAYTVLNMLNN